MCHDTKNQNRNVQSVKVMKIKNVYPGKVKQFHHEFSEKYVLDILNCHAYIIGLNWLHTEELDKFEKLLNFTLKDISLILLLLYYEF